jgi:hypothetical protein
MSNPKQVIVFDRHIVSWSGHWMQFALDLVELYEQHGYKPAIVVNDKFGRGAFKQRKKDLRALKDRVRLVPTLEQKVFYKKKHPYEKLPLRHYSVVERANLWFFKPGEVRSILYFGVADFRAGDFKNSLQFIQFLFQHMRGFGTVLDLAAATVAAGGWGINQLFQGRPQAVWDRVSARLHAIDQRAEKRATVASELWERFRAWRRQKAGYEKAFRRLDPGPGDQVLFQTAELPDLVALERILASNPRWRRADYRLFLRTPLWDREGNMLEPPEETKLLRKTLLQLQNWIPNVHMFGDTEELVDQFHVLGFRRVRLVPILFGAAVSRRLDEALENPPAPASKDSLNLLRSGSAQREKGFLTLPDIVKAAQVSRREIGLPPLTFTIQATMLRFQPRWEKLVETINRLNWFKDGDVRLVRKELTTDEYMVNLEQADIVLSPNRSVPYTHGSTGTTIEAVRAGKPMVTLGENWGARQLRNLDIYVDHLETFARETAVARIGDEAFLQDPRAFEGGWKELETTWRPYCHVYDWQIAMDVARRAEFQLPKDATEVVVFVNNADRKLYPGDVAKVGVQMTRSMAHLCEDRANRDLFAYADPTAPLPVWRYFGGQRTRSANIWRLRPGTRSIQVGLVLLDRRISLDRLSLEVVVCRNPGGARPISAAGYMADNPFEVIEGMEEVVRHVDHYRATAREAAFVLRQFHNREVFWEAFSTDGPDRRSRAG